MTTQPASLSFLSKVIRRRYVPLSSQKISSSPRLHRDETKIQKAGRFACQRMKTLSSAERPLPPAYMLGSCYNFSGNHVCNPRSSLEG